MSLFFDTIGGGNRWLLSRRYLVWERGEPLRFATEFEAGGISQNLQIVLCTTTISRILLKQADKHETPK